MLRIYANMGMNSAIANQCSLVKSSHANMPAESHAILTQRGV